MAKAKLPRGRPKADEKKKMYSLYFKPSFMEGFQRLAESEGMTTSQLIEKTFKKKLC